ncbi:MAG: TOBE domain-containing protein, partial [Chitinophagaceae bacterium]|nr:TOBE domain-containing protein [Rubrivivax sp.]
GQLSGGQRQRVAMGRALARSPGLFLFDEPLSNLDAKLRVEMRAEIKLLHQRTRTTTVYVTHDQVEAMTLGDRIAVMKDGVVQQFGTPDDIYSRPATRFVAEFIGSPVMNMVAAERAGAGLRAQGGAAPFELPTTPAQQAALAATPAPTGAAGAAVAAGASGEGIVYGLRPEDLRVADTGLPGTLRMIEPTGPETYLSADTAVGPLTVRLPGPARQRVGDSVHLQWHAERAHLFDALSTRRIG